MLGYGGSRQPLIMADFREAKKNLCKEEGLAVRGLGLVPQMDRAFS
jgi:hypothetical protein